MHHPWEWEETLLGELLWKAMTIMPIDAARTAVPAMAHFCHWFFIPASAESAALCPAILGWAERGFEKRKRRARDRGRRRRGRSLFI